MAQERLRPVKIRLPESLRRELRRLASANRRSMNTEIITRLERSLESETRLYRDFRQRREADELRRFDEILRHFKLLTNQVRKGQKEQNRLLTLLLESKGRDGS